MRALHPLVLFLLGFLVSCGSGGPPGARSGGPASASSARGLSLDDGGSSPTVPGEPPPTAAGPAPKCDSAAPDSPDARGKATMVVQDGHSSRIMATVLSSDGHYLASGGEDGTARLWDTQSGIQLRRVPTGGMTLEVSIDAAARKLAYHSHTGSGEAVAVVDFATGATHTIAETGSIQMSHDGKTVFVALRALREHDAATGAKLRELEFPEGSVKCFTQKCAVRAMALEPTGKRLAVALEGELAIVDLASWKTVRRWPQPSFAGPQDLVMHLEFTGDTIVATTARTMHILGAAEGAPARSVPGTYLTAAVLGSRVVTADMSRKLAAFELGTGAPASLPALEPRVDRLAASADGSTLVVGMAEADERFLQVRDGKSLALLRTIEAHTSPIWALAMRADGSALTAEMYNGRIARWDLKRGELLGVGGGEEWSGRASLDYDASGAQVAETVGSYYVRVRDAASGKLLRQWNAHGGKNIALVGFAPGGKDLYTVDKDGNAMRWDLSAAAAPAPPGAMRFTEFGRPSGKPVGKFGWEPPSTAPPTAQPPGGKPPARPGPIKPPPMKPPPPPSKAPAPSPPPPGAPPVTTYWETNAALSADGTSIVAIGKDELKMVNFKAGTISSAPTGRMFTETHVALMSSRDGAVRWEHTLEVADAHDRWIGFSTDGKSVLVSSNEPPKGATGPVRPRPTVRVLDASTGAVQRTVEVGTAGPILARGELVAIGGKKPGLYTWPALTLRAEIATPDSSVRAIASDARGQLFALGGESGTVTLASARTAKQIAVLAATDSGDFVTATPEGEFNASTDGARSVAWSFDGPLEGFSFEQFSGRFDRPEIVAKRLMGESVPAPKLARPPTLDLARAGVPATTAAKTVKVKASVASAQRVDRIRVFVDGRPAVDKLVCKARSDVEIDVPLHAGKNRITAIAYDGDGVASNAKVADVTCTAAEAQRPDFWIVSVGVSRYPKLAAEQQLNFADDDARSIAAAFSKQAGAGGPFARVHATTLIDDQVTVDGLMTALQGLGQMRPDDLAVVFLAGHGVRLKDGKMVYLTSTASLTSEGAKQGGVGWDRIHQALGRARGRVVLLLDACHSGHVSTEIVAPNEDLAKELAAADRAGVLVFAAARGAQYSYEVPGNEAAGATRSARGLELAWEGQPPQAPPTQETGHGLFTSAVLEATAGRAPDRDRSGAVEVGEFVDYVTERVRALSKGKQTPWVARREMFGDFVLSPASR